MAEPNKTTGAGQGSPVAPSLQDIIARQMAEAAERIKAKQVEPKAKPKPQEPAPAAAPVPAAETAFGEGEVDPLVAAVEQALGQSKPAAATPPAPAKTAAAPAAPAPAANADEVAQLLSSDEFEGIDASELEGLSPQEAELIKGMLVATAQEKARKDKQAAEAAAPATTQAQPPVGSVPMMAAAPRSRISLMHLVLAMNSVAIIAVVALACYFLPQRQTVNASPAPAPDVAPTAAKGVEPAQPEPAVVTWAAAQKAYAAGDFIASAAIYRAMLKGVVGQTSESSAMAELLRLRLAQCDLKSKRTDEAHKQFLSVANSISPAVAYCANYQLAQMEMANNKYLLAHMRSFQAAAVAGVLTRSAELERDCDFLSARAVTLKALTLSNIDLPLDLGSVTGGELFDGLDEQAALGRLSEGMPVIASAMLGPQVRKVSADPANERFDIASRSSSLEDVLAKLSAETGCEIKWSGVESSIRQRGISMAAKGVSLQRACELACGSAGLIGRYTGEAILVSDPASCTDIKAQRELLSEAASATWRRLTLRHNGDKRIAQMNFIQALLTEAGGDAARAINEYELIPQQYPDSQVAPLAILRAAKLRISMRDFASAREELSRLLDNYPHCTWAEEAYMALAQSTLQAGAHEEAARLFRKLHLMESSPATKGQACLGAGRAYFRQANFEDASVWLGRYLSVAKDAPKEERCEALILVGRSEIALNHLAAASASLHLALAVCPPGPQRTSVILDLANLHIRQQNYSVALNAIKELEKHQLTPADACQAGILQARAMRCMGLAESAISLLRRRILDLKDAHLKARACLELSRCFVDNNQIDEAHQILGDALPELTAPESTIAQCELADLCVRLGKHSQAVTLCMQVKASKPGKTLESRATRTLADAYIGLREFDKAGLATAELAKLGESTSKSATSAPTTQGVARHE